MLISNRSVLSLARLQFTAFPPFVYVSPVTLVTRASTLGDKSLLFALIDLSLCFLSGCIYPTVSSENWLQAHHMDSKSWKAQVSHIQGHSVYVYIRLVFNSVDIVNLKIVDSVGIKLMATGAQCN